MYETDFLGSALISSISAKLVSCRSTSGASNFRFLATLIPFPVGMYDSASASDNPLSLKSLKYLSLAPMDRSWFSKSFSK